MSLGQLAALLVEHAPACRERRRSRSKKASSCVSSGERFAVLGGGPVDLRLRPEVASAALRTPDASPSPRGPGWVRFGPPVLDGFARDRAIAWLESAWRFADEGGAAALQAP